MFDCPRVGGAESVANQSLRGLFARLDHTRAIATRELLSLGVVFGLGVRCAAIAYRQLVFVSYRVWLLPHQGGEELRYTRWQTALSAPYVLAGLGFLMLTVRRAGRPEVRPSRPTYARRADQACANAAR